MVRRAGHTTARATAERPLEVDGGIHRLRARQWGQRRGERRGPVVRLTRRTARGSGRSRGNHTNRQHHRRRAQQTERLSHSSAPLQGPYVHWWTGSRCRLLSDAADISPLDYFPDTGAKKPILWCARPTRPGAPPHSGAANGVTTRRRESTGTPVASNNSQTQRAFALTSTWSDQGEYPRRAWLSDRFVTHRARGAPEVAAFSAFRAVSAGGHVAAERPVGPCDVNGPDVVTPEPDAEHRSIPRTLRDRARSRHDGVAHATAEPWTAPLRATAAGRAMRVRTRKRQSLAGLDGSFDVYPVVA